MATSFFVQVTDDDCLTLESFLGKPLWSYIQGVIKVASEKMGVPESEIKRVLEEKLNREFQEGVKC